MRYAEYYLNVLMSNYYLYDDCRKALLFHRLYLSLEKLLEKYLSRKSLPAGDSKTWHKDVAEAAALHLGLSKGVCAVLDELRRFRHLFVNNHTLYAFDEQKLDAIFTIVKSNLKELNHILKEISK